MPWQIIRQPLECNYSRKQIRSKASRSFQRNNKLHSPWLSVEVTMPSLSSNNSQDSKEDKEVKLRKIVLANRRKMGVRVLEPNACRVRL